ncbi:hypothetical protein C8J31_102829 [Rhizobium sp. PP-CC-2G-626]|nr:hypothetical protein C8J31_102829 [Rhizobium sp. PP-CC-2G-626]
MTNSHRTAAGRAIFYPPDSLQECSNYKRYIYVDRDGCDTERVLLNILDKRAREEVICIHFMQFLVKNFIGETTGFNILSRDNPWDFRLGLSTGVKFNLEIVSIADNRLHFETLSREEARDSAAYRPKLRLRDLAKIAKQFPDRNIVEVVTHHHNSGICADDLIDNPDFGVSSRVYISTSAPREGSLADVIDQAIAGKEAKSGPDKGETVLIIDNRTSVYFVDEVTDALGSLTRRLAASPFKEIWFYNGYCSDHDGRNGQYTMIGCKLTT